MSIETAAVRLRWAIWILWGVLLLAYLAGRLGLSFGPVQVEARPSTGAHQGLTAVADISLALLTVALLQLNRMLAAISAGDFFSARVIGAFRAFALWLLLLACFWIAGPLLAAVVAGPGDSGRLEFTFQLRDILTVGITLILFLVARLLERARSIEAEMREIV